MLARCIHDSIANSAGEYFGHPMDCEFQVEGTSASRHREYLSNTGPQVPGRGRLIGYYRSARTGNQQESPYGNLPNGLLLASWFDIPHGAEPVANVQVRSLTFHVDPDLLNVVVTMMVFSGLASCHFPAWSLSWNWLHVTTCATVTAVLPETLVES